MDAHDEYLRRIQAVKDEAAKFPGEFGLRAFPGMTFRVSEAASYYSDSEGVMLYTEVKTENTWMAFCKGSPAELRKEMVVKK